MQITEVGCRQIRNSGHIGGSPMHRSARDVCSRRCCDVSYSWKRHTRVMCSGSGGGSVPTTVGPVALVSESDSPRL